MKKHSRLLLAVVFTGLIFSACKKEVTKSPSSASATTAQSDDLVPTPAGMLPRSHGHLIEKGFMLSRQGSHLVKLNARTRQLVEDFGEVHPGKPVAGGTLSHTTTATAPRVATSSAPPTSDGWVTWAQWQNTSTSPITSFSTNWTVPNAPATNDGQLLYLFNGFEGADQAEIMQPVLQWGIGPDGGGYNWYIANWYVWGSDWAYSEPLQVNPGDALQGVLVLNGQNGDGSYNYTSSFTGYSNPLNVSVGVVPFGGSGSTIPDVPQQVWSYLTLEVYNLAQASDYPAGQNFVEMNNISLYQGSTFTSLTWSPETSAAYFGENTVVKASDLSIPRLGGTSITLLGDVFLYFHPAPQIDGQNLNVGFTPSSPAAVTITGYPGGLVYVLMDATATATSSTTSTFTITTPGVTFPDGSSSFSVSRSNSTGTSQGVKAFYMPAGGSITANCTVVSNNPTGGLGIRIPPGEVNVY